MATKKSSSGPHIEFQGLKIFIENPSGSVREGTSKAGVKWRTEMKNDYGYVKRTEGVDGDHVDVFIGPNDKAEYVYVVHQVKPATGEYDEDKCMLGFDSSAAAKKAYLAHYDTPKFFGAMTTVPLSLFKEKIFNDKGEPIISDIERKLAVLEEKHLAGRHNQLLHGKKINERQKEFLDKKLLVAVQKNPKVKKLHTTLISLGGEHAVIDVNDRDFHAITTRGKLQSNPSVILNGDAHACHSATASLYVQSPEQYRINTGYFLTNSVWKPHSWLTDANNNTVETTSVVPDAYYGVELSDIEAEQFCAREGAFTLKHLAGKHDQKKHATKNVKTTGDPIQYMGCTVEMLKGSDNVVKVLSIDDTTKLLSSVSQATMIYDTENNNLYMGDYSLSHGRVIADILRAGGMSDLDAERATRNFYGEEDFTDYGYKNLYRFWVYKTNIGVAYDDEIAPNSSKQTVSALEHLRTRGVPDTAIVDVYGGSSYHGGMPLIGAVRGVDTGVLKHLPGKHDQKKHRPIQIYVNRDWTGRDEAPTVGVYTSEDPKELVGRLSDYLAPHGFKILYQESDRINASGIKILNLNGGLSTDWIHLDKYDDGISVAAAVSAGLQATGWGELVFTLGKLDLAYNEEMKKDFRPRGDWPPVDPLYREHVEFRPHATRVDETQHEPLKDDLEVLHGTNDTSLPGILKEGLQPGKATSFAPYDPHTQAVNVASKSARRLARYYARLRSEARGGNPVLLTIKIPKGVDVWHDTDESDAFVVDEILPEWITDVEHFEKHLPGKHDQQTHGHGEGGVERQELERNLGITSSKYTYKKEAKLAIQHGEKLFAQLVPQAVSNLSKINWSAELSVPGRNTIQGNNLFQSVTLLRQRGLNEDADKLQAAIRNEAVGLVETLGNKKGKIIADNDAIVSFFDSSPGLNDAGNWIADAISTPIPAVPVGVKAGRRSNASPEGINIAAEADEPGQHLAHEFGHMLGWSSPTINNAARSFIDSRAGPVVELRSYKDAPSEKVYSDAFIDPYIGKVYQSDANEALSVGLQFMYASPRRLLNTDPDHFFLTLSAMHNKGDIETKHLPGQHDQQRHASKQAIISDSVADYRPIGRITLPADTYREERTFDLDPELVCVKNEDTFMRSDKALLVDVNTSKVYFGHDHGTVALSAVVDLSGREGSSLDAQTAQRYVKLAELALYNGRFGRVWTSSHPYTTPDGQDMPGDCLVVEDYRDGPVYVNRIKASLRNVGFTKPIYFFEPTGYVLKHLAGRHDQKKHAGATNLLREPESMEEFAIRELFGSVELTKPVILNEKDLPPVEEGHTRIYHGTMFNRLSAIDFVGVKPGAEVGLGEQINNVLASRNPEEKFGNTVVIADVPNESLTSINDAWVELPQIEPEHIQGYTARPFPMEMKLLLELIKRYENYTQKKHKSLTEDLS